MPANMEMQKSNMESMEAKAEFSQEDLNVVESNAEDFSNALEADAEMGKMESMLAAPDPEAKEIVEQSRDMEKASSNLDLESKSIMGRLVNNILTNPTVLDDTITIKWKTDKDKYHNWVNKETEYNKLYSSLKAQYPNINIPNWDLVKTEVSTNNNDGNIALGYTRALAGVSELLSQLKSTGSDTEKVIGQLWIGFDLNNTDARGLEVAYGLDDETPKAPEEKPEVVEDIKEEIESAEKLPEEPIKSIIMLNPKYGNKNEKFIKKLEGALNEIGQSVEERQLENWDNYPYIYIDARTQKPRPLGMYEFDKKMENNGVFVQSPDEIKPIVDTVSELKKAKESKEDTDGIKRKLMAQAEKAESNLEDLKNSVMVFVRLVDYRDKTKIFDGDMSTAKAYKDFIPQPIIMLPNGAMKKMRNLTPKAYAAIKKGGSPKVMGMKLNPENIIMSQDKQEQLTNIYESKNPQEAYTNLVALK